MIRLECIKESENTRDAAEYLLPLICEETKDCPGKCGECTKKVEDFLEEEL